MICTKEAHEKCPLNSMCDIGELVADDSECADRIMEATKGVQSAYAWISVKDKRPEVPCLAVDTLGQILYIRTSVSWKVRGEWRSYDGEDFDLETMDFKTVMVDGEEKKLCKEITYWMPLPKPPKEKSSVKMDGGAENANVV